MQISFIGMQTQEVAIKPSLKIFLKSDSQMIDEVMVVAYGTAKKSSFTGSASTVKADKLAERSVSNVTNALAGQVSGVQTIANNGQPGSAATVRIRGIGSMSASNSPLYVVDGIPFDGSISSINPQDIESMTVLKDAAANAIYGARGANGVILITTKKGDSKEAVITVDAKWGSNRRAVPTYDVMTDPGMYYETMYRALYNSKAYNGSSMTEAYAFADAVLLDDKNGGLTEDARNIIRNELSDYVIAGDVTPWVGEVKPGQSALAQAESMKQCRALKYDTSYGSQPLRAIAFTMTDKKSDGHRYYLALQTQATIKTPQN